MVDKISYKGQVILIKSERNAFKYDKSYHPKGVSNKPFKKISVLTEFSTPDDVKKDAMERIDLELEKGNWIWSDY